MNRATIQEIRDALVADIDRADLACDRYHDENELRDAALALMRRNLDMMNGRLLALNDLLALPEEPPATSEELPSDSPSSSSCSSPPAQSPAPPPRRPSRSRPT